MARVNNLALSFFHPPEKLNIWQWAERHRYLAKGVSNKSKDGVARYSTADAPHQREPQEAFTDPAVQITVLCGASQVMGKTEMLNNAIFYHMAHRPRNIIMLRPTNESCEKYSKKKFTPSAEATPIINDLLRNKRSRDSGNTILVKEFTGGSIFFVGANSPSSLRGDSAEVLLGDEIDDPAMQNCPEGDAVELLWKRGESFSQTVKILSSTPTTAARDEHGLALSPIWNYFEQSDRRYWFVPCPKCGTYQQLTWAQIVWPKADGKPLTRQTTLLCSHCAAALNDRQRRQMYYDGRWQPTAPFNGIRGYHLNGIYTPWAAHKGFDHRLHEMAEEFLRARRKGATTMRVWVNTFLSEPYEEENEKPYDPAGIVKRLENYTPDKLPAAIVLLLAAVDVQKDRLECEVVGLGLDDETWGVEYVKLFGDTEQDEVWDNLTEFLHSQHERADQTKNVYTRTDGVPLVIKAVAVDTQYHGSSVRKWARRCGLRQGDISQPGFYLVQGKGNPGPLLVTRRLNKQYRLRTWSIDTKQAKDTIFSRLRIEDPGPRYLHFPNGHGYGEEYSKGLASEIIKRHREAGRVHETYEKINSSIRNEPLDLRVYLLAAVDILRPNLTALAKQLRPPASGAGGASVPASRDYILKPTPESGGQPSGGSEKSAEKKPAKPFRPAKKPKRGSGFNPLGL